MKKGGRGGANTKTGATYESKSVLQVAIRDLPDYEVKPGKIGFDLFYKGKLVAHSYKQHDLYKFLRSKEVDYKDHISKKLLPDDAIFVFSQNKASIVEIKYQEVAGSVDEKLQTCDFKKKQYQKLLQPLDLDVSFIYVLSSWFQKPEYKDVLNYVQSVGCEYFFDDLPLDALGLPGGSDIEVKKQ